MLNDEKLKSHPLTSSRPDENPADIENTLRQSEECFRKIFDHSNDAIFIIEPERNQIVEANPQACRMLGYSYDELLNTNISAIHPNEMPLFLQFGQTVVKEGHGWTNELCCLTKSGEKLSSEISASTIEIGGRTCLIAQVRDITERKRTEQALRENEARLSCILKSVMDAIFTIDQNRQIVLFNRAAEKVFGCSAAECLGQPIDRFLSTGFRKLLLPYLSDSDKGKHSPSYLWTPEGLTARRANGEEFPIEATISRVTVSGQKLFTIILRDINDRRRIEAALNKLQLQNLYLEEAIKSEYNFGEIIGASTVMKKVFKNIEKVAATDTTVLITGETGTGKELIARAIHNRSNRKKSVLINVNCSALPSGLVESELFGHEKGAFTGATARKKGRFELADGGTIFLDEVGELPLDTQTKLLRVLQEQEFERVGSAETIKVELRVIAATNRNLEEAVKQGAFRADLFYRLNIFPINIPPLRERLEDLQLLAGYFSQKFSRRICKKIKSLSPQVLEKLRSYHWPGNVRELANILERAIILCECGELNESHIGISTTSPVLEPESISLEESERQHILQALEKTGSVLGGPQGAAALLGINRSTLWSKMKKLGIT